MIDPSGDAEMIMVIGEADRAFAPRLSADVHRALDRRPVVLVLDCIGVTEVGAACLLVLDGVLARAATLRVRLDLLYLEHSAMHAALHSHGLAWAHPPIRTQ
jgi:ABC-type transporter Mla MlaB component